MLLLLLSLHYFHSFSCLWLGRVTGPSGRPCTPVLACIQYLDIVLACDICIRIVLGHLEGLDGLLLPFLLVDGRLHAVRKIVR